MKWSKWFVLLLVMMSCCVGALADSCACYYAPLATFFIGANFGEGSNASFTLIGPSVNVSGLGGTPFDTWLGNPDIGYAPGSTGGGPATLEFDEGMSGTLGPYNSNSSVFSTECCSYLDVGTFTFPSHGSVFTVTLPASISGISGTITTPSGTVIPMSVSFGGGNLTMTFDLNSSTGLYYFGQASFTTVPEPTTLALMGTGLIAVLGSVRRRLNR